MKRFEYGRLARRHGLQAGRVVEQASARRPVLLCRRQRAAGPSLLKSMLMQICASRLTAIAPAKAAHRLRAA
jgi:hypothetical protein